MSSRRCSIRLERPILLCDGALDVLSQNQVRLRTRRPVVGLSRKPSDLDERGREPLAALRQAGAVLDDRGNGAGVEVAQA